jgi:hypothetical protein
VKGIAGATATIFFFGVAVVAGASVVTALVVRTALTSMCVDAAGAAVAVGVAVVAERAIYPANGVCIWRSSEE